MDGALLRTLCRSGAHFAWFAAFATLILFLLTPQPAHAQVGAVTIQKQLCDASGCNLANQATGVSPGAAVFYKISLNNPTGNPITLDVRDSLPTGFQTVGYACGATVNAGTAITASTAQNLVIPGITVGPGATVECKIAGTFASAVASASNTAAITAPGSSIPVKTSNILNNGVQLTGPQPYNLSIAKSVDLSSVDVSISGPKQVVFTITITNTGNEDLYLGKLLSIEDRLRLMTSSAVLNAGHVVTTCAIVAAPSTTTTVSDCLHPVPFLATPQPMTVNSAAPLDFARWRYPTGSPGLLKANDQIVLKVTVDIDAVPGADCIIAANSDGLIDQAHIVLTLPSSVPNGPITTLNDNNPADNSSPNVAVSVVTGATVVNPNCNAPFLPPSPVLKVTKTQLTPTQPGGLPWGPGNPIAYEVEIENISTTGITVSGLKIADWVIEGVETPPFTATIVSATCPDPVQVPPANPNCLAPLLTPPQTLAGNSDTKQLFGALVPGTLAPNAKFKFGVVVEYSNPQCDSYPGVNPKPIHNVGMVTGWTQTVPGNLPGPVTQTVIGAVTTLMQSPPACPLKVAKTLDTTNPTPVKFGSPIQYTVTYSNPDPSPYTMGTLFDGMRLVRNPAANPTPYALQLRVDYRHACSTTTGVTGFPAFNPADPTGTLLTNDIAYVTETQLPQQGVRLIRNLTPVTFPGGSSLTCTVTATVQPPDPNDPYCSTGMLENAAVLDASNFYNPNTPWPTTSTPGMWASVTAPLPRCFDVRVNKEVPHPGWTWQGGPLKWILTVTNQGLPIAGGEVEIADLFSPPLNPAESTSCTGAGCAAAWSPGPSTNNPSTLEISSLPTSGQVVTSFTTLAPRRARPGTRFCNDATASVQTTDHWYWKNPAITHSRACVDIIATASLTIEKKVKNRTGIPLSGSFTIDVVCTNRNPIYNGPSTSVTLAAGTSTGIDHIPVGNSCTVQEDPPAVPPGTSRCLFPFWETTYSPAPPVVIAARGAKVEVTNTLACRPTGTLQLEKETALPLGMSVPFATIAFTVNCTPFGPSTTVSVPINGLAPALVVPAPSVCTALEQVPAAPPGCEWEVFQSSPGGVKVEAGAIVTLTVSNRLVCSTGTVTVGKETLLPPVLFDVNCTPNGPNMTILVPANGQAPSFTVAPPGRCTITEQVPPAPPGCRWVTSQAPAGALTVGGGTAATVTVTNQLVCEGRLVIVKSTNVPTGVQQPASFLFNVNCGGSPMSVSAPANGSAPALAVSAPALCTVVEQVPVAPAGCSWSSVQIPPGTVAIPINATVTVKVDNRLSCPERGRLEILKKTVFPPGVPQNLSVNFNVDCSPGGFSTSTGGPTNGTHTVYNIPAPSTCIIVEQPMSAPAGCTWVPTQSPPGNVPVAPGVTTIVNVTNTLKCQGPGTLEIRKLLDLPAGATPIPSFQAQVSCKSGFTTTVTVPANGAAPPVSIAAPAVCSVSEILPPAPAGCSWSAPAYVPTAVPTISTGVNSVVLIINKLTCSPPGTLVIRKTTTAPINKPVPAAFTFNVGCTPGGPNTAVSVPANGQSAGLSVPAGSTCTVTEQVPPPPFACSWTTTTLQPVTVAAGATVTIAASNTMVCSPTGNLIIAKKTIGAAPAQIPFSVNCSPSGYSIPAAMVPSNGQTVAFTIPAPATCTIVERVPPAPAGCSWKVTQTPIGPHSVAPGVTTTVQFANELVCNAAGELIIKKTTAFGPLPASFTAVSFNVNCTPGGPSTIVSVPANGQASLGIAAAATCAIVEQPPTAPAGCAWFGTQTPPGNVAVAAGATVTVSVANQLVCAPIIVLKTTIVPPGVRLSFNAKFTANCGRLSNAVSGPANGPIAFTSVPAPAVCTLTEQTPPTPAGCAWTIAQVPPGSVATRPGVAAIVSVTNTLVCSQASSGRPADTSAALIR